MLSSVNNRSGGEGWRANRGFVCTLVQSSLQKNFSSCYSELAGTAITKKKKRESHPSLCWWLVVNSCFSGCSLRRCLLRMEVVGILCRKHCQRRELHQFTSSWETELSLPGRVVGWEFQQRHQGMGPWDSESSPASTRQNLLPACGSPSLWWTCPPLSQPVGHTPLAGAWWGCRASLAHSRSPQWVGGSPQCEQSLQGEGRHKRDSSRSSDPVWTQSRATQFHRQDLTRGYSFPG